ncbi:MAG: 3-deoxy-7-phosphoheptulonate synthase [Selenomonas sp.]|jgi:3-deoxy-7-phosphoheptulonate synthase|uniref:3-deoxy-7-phosphoheptulonate synthase n=1 Tax=Selenomonas sp. AE3005 TaxID=1485543 RepID=UPI000488A161|nr:3-deoxy-7-phosphoheptulonate synthase [Selenomonas sp. AE3005]MBQ1615312.1 3-deoxy-7-phosphoheptulonate synthase [Selenomonas sp.]MBQ2137051.1 3-deoxy-7-phosphoheptulonate synthase [Selenomonas sp.]MBQ5419955.1 3-deoxy-7-phosphoheptulonate synthase [Selenomonas sp.]
MVIIMNLDATAEDINGVISAIESAGLQAKVMEGSQQKIVGVIGDKTKLASMPIDALPGVEKSVEISKSYKLASREFHPANSVIDVAGIKIGDGTPVVMAGPCAVESKEQLFEAADIVKKAGAQFLRGGAYKPRTSPYAFQGLEVEGLKFLAEARERTGLRVVTEVTTVEAIDRVVEYADMLQIGARNMQNFGLLKEVGKCGKPVLLKRGLAATIDEWLNAAEYIMNAGNPNVVLCERGIRTYETYTRNTLDLSAVAAVKHLSHLPIIVDPSHGTGKWRMVKPMAFAAIAAGADGLMMEVHPNPAKALSDGPQSLTPENYAEVMDGVKKISAFMKAENITSMDI